MYIEKRKDPKKSVEPFRFVHFQHKMITIAWGIPPCEHFQTMSLLTTCTAWSPLQLHGARSDTPNLFTVAKHPLLLILIVRLQLSGLFTEDTLVAEMASGPVRLFSNPWLMIPMNLRDRHELESYCDCCSSGPSSSHHHHCTKTDSRPTNWSPKRGLPYQSFPPLAPGHVVPLAPEGAADPVDAQVPLVPEGDNDGDHDDHAVYPHLFLDDNVDPNPPATPPDDPYDT